jgi:hypothetical protein
MLTILAHLWPGLAAAAAFGVAIGWWSGAAGPMRPGGRLAAILAALCLIAAAAVAGLGLVPGRAGFWLDSAVLHALAYLVGAGLGSIARGLGRPGPVVTAPTS